MTNSHPEKEADLITRIAWMYYHEGIDLSPGIIQSLLSVQAFSNRHL
jgi:hypothetical protein